MSARLNGFDTVARRLRTQLVAIAAARLARDDTPRWWRRAALLWPLFTKG